MSVNVKTLKTPTHKPQTLSELKYLVALKTGST